MSANNWNVSAPAPVFNGCPMCVLQIARGETNCAICFCFRNDTCDRIFILSTGIYRCSFFHNQATLWKGTNNADDNSRDRYWQWTLIIHNSAHVARWNKIRNRFLCICARRSSRPNDVQTWPGSPNSMFRNGPWHVREASRKGCCSFTVWVIAGISTGGVRSTSVIQRWMCR